MTLPGVSVAWCYNAFICVMYAHFVSAAFEFVAFLGGWSKPFVVVRNEALSPAANGKPLWCRQWIQVPFKRDCRPCRPFEM